jgi:hypothetical protein
MNDLIDATPNEGYPLRILRAYRQNCNMIYSPTDTTAKGVEIINTMTRLNMKRAEILDRAIAILEKSNGENA